MNKVKIILLIGRTGRGKSTLANVITNTNNFKESAGSISETRKIQYEKFEDKDNDINYLIIDTPGIGDTKLSDHQVLDIIAEAVYLARDGINQVFFVTNGRFDQYEMATYDLLRTIIFDKDITNHTTVVRTYFSEFRDEEEWKTDVVKMIEEAEKKNSELEKSLATKKKEKKKKIYLSVTNSDQYKELSKEIKELKKKLASTNLAEIIESCQERVIYVDNPSLEVEDANKLRLNKEDRDDSREVLLEHLSKNCQEISYKPPKLQELSNEIADDYFEYLKKREELEKELEKFRSQEVHITKDSNNNTFTEISKIEPIFAKSEEETKVENIGIFEKEELRKKISQLQDKKERLKKEIAEKEKIIRQKVLKHIFNNYQEISKELGGDVFLNSVVGDHNWIKINPEFTNKELVVKWLSQGFDYQQTQKWASVLESNFDPKIDADFCAWLRDDKQLTVEKIKELNHFIDIEQLRKEYAWQLEKETSILTKRNQQLEKKDWKKIHNCFSKESSHLKKTYQQVWKDYDLTYQDAQEWITVGFEPHDYWKIKDWKKHNFNSLQAKLWNEIGLDKKDVELATYLKNKGHQPSLDLNLEQLKKEFNSWLKNKARNAQEWLDENYPKEGTCRRESEGYNWENISNYGKKREEINKLLDIRDQNFTNSLKLTGFVNLEELRCYGNQLTELDCSGCQRLVTINCNGSQLTDNNLVLPVNNRIRELRCWGNQLTSLPVNLNPETLTSLIISSNKFQADLIIFNHLVNLEVLKVNNNHFTDSLAPLMNLRKLKRLDISDTQIKGGLEYLPESLTEFKCKETKLAKELEVYGEPDGSNYLNLLQGWKKNHQQLVAQVQVPPKELSK